MKKLFLLSLLLINCIFLNAQIATESTLPSELYTLSTNITTHHMPAFNLKKVLEAEEKRIKNANKIIPPRFGHKMKINLNLQNAGQWETLSNGDRVWRLVIKSKGALSLNYLFSQFHMPKGGEFFMTNQDQSYVLGAFTEINNKSYGSFSTSPIKGDVTIFEYYEPAAVKGQGVIQFSHIVHAYKDIFKTMESLAKGYGDSGPCNIDVECSLGNNWQNQIKSVALILVNGNDWCSGAMVNNTTQDGTPYFLTANHCLTANLTTWTFVFNYESPTCGGGNGSLAQSVSGATLKASATSSDFALLELSSPPPPSYYVYYAGWNKSGIAVDSTIAIHHPSSDVKKISFNEDLLINGISQGSNYWRVTEWELGTTEGGSSGSPLFDNNGHIIGQLQGGLASCNAPTQYDEYGKFSVSWDLNSSNNQQLKHWLDPNNTGVTAMNGTYFSNLASFDIALTSIEYPSANNATCNTAINPIIKVRNLGDSVVTHFDVEYYYDNQSVSTYTWNGNLATLQETTITLPTSNLTLGTHQFYANVTMPNDSMDLNMTNDSLGTPFNIIQGNSLQVRFSSDANPMDNDFNIIDDNGNVIFTRSGFNPNDLYIEDFCLADGCYRFVFNDTGDGQLLNNGEFVVMIGSDTIGVVNGSFSSDTLYACLPNHLKANFNIKSTYCTGEIIAPQNTSQMASTWVWTMPGATPTSSNLQSPSFSYNTPGTYNINLSVSGILGIVEDTTISVTITDGIEVTINLLTDAYPDETSYRILDDNGNTLFSLDNITAVETLLTKNICLPNGCYDFVIEDSYGDGLSGTVFGSPGSFSVVVNSNTIDSTIGDFGYSDTLHICISNTIIANFEIAPSYCIGQPIQPINTSINAVAWNWTMPNASITSSNSETPFFSYSTPGNYNITLISTDANGAMDTMSTTVNIIDGHIVTIDLLTDDYPSETSYEVLNSQGNQVFFNDDFSNSNTHYIEDLCLTTGCYTLVFYDTQNDGICCSYGNGSFSVTDANNQLLGSGGQFTDSVHVNFCITTVNTNKIEKANAIKIYPNPTNGRLFFESETAPSRIELVDVIGRNVLNIENVTVNYLDMNTISSGIYVVRFYYESKIVTKKVIKE